MKNKFIFMAVFSAILLTSCGLGQYGKSDTDAKVSFKVPDWGESHWIDIPENPLIGNEYTDPGMAIGDPQLLTPGDFDGKWHVFFHGFGFGPGATTFFHQISEDGIHWQEVSRQNGEVGIQYVFCDGDRWIQYYTCTTSKTDKPELKKYHNVIRARTTRDFINWTEPVDIIYPETPAERDGYNVQARNPCVILLPNGRYRMYYSAGTVYLRDAGYEEPKYIFCAESDNPLGPFKKLGEPILSPDVNLPYRNYGCGGFKVFGYGDGYVAFYNPIYIDSNQKSRSEIRMLVSDDGLSWKEADGNPVITPNSSYPWRSAIVYQLDVINHDDALWMYFNAREGWRGGIERIGACRLPLNGATPVRKLQKKFKL
ncbi:hypothetical protein FACS1894199_18980 [Bacteroidia bacterium]|nr:hypothetical protein FACS1894199_18980 [Bacteroidia bacterium]